MNYYIIYYILNIILVGGFNPENISQLGLLFPIYGKIKHVSNHQPVLYIYIPKFMILMYID
jgi:hypothetical protein